MSRSIDMDTLIDQIRHLDADQLREVQEEVILRSKRLSRLAVRSFEVGDKVTFVGRNGRTVEGLVYEIKRKYIHVCDPTGSLWQVPADMLKAA